MLDVVVTEPANGMAASTKAHLDKAQSLLEAILAVKGSRTVDNTLAALRKKVERDPAEPRLILTVRGKGYRWGGP